MGNGVINMFKKLFKQKKSELELEQELTDEIIKQNNEIKNQITAGIIRYTFKEDTDMPQIEFLGSFYSDLLPDIGSILWLSNKEKKKLLPYKVIRFDFIGNLNNSTTDNYIVVEHASMRDIGRFDIV